MRSENDSTGPDALAASGHGTSPVSVVTARVYTSSAGTFFEVWTGVTDSDKRGHLVYHQKWPRSLRDNPDPVVQAAFLARMVAAADREGWPMITS